MGLLIHRIKIYWWERPTKASDCRDAAYFCGATPWHLCGSAVPDSQDTGPGAYRQTNHPGWGASALCPRRSHLWTWYGQGLQLSGKAQVFEIKALFLLLCS